ncbi:hypothetical protein T12_16030 [Trichinella patagoniensis]|uniref:Uncharacterized protein n=1 Tax=Trichinella patagoniensis TaxID=990121 RepID=A0A0V0ZR77_9BILA|nr:hypothetical protein T12_16030 [Trichinella patagoniensis]
MTLSIVYVWCTLLEMNSKITQLETTDSKRVSPVMVAEEENDFAKLDARISSEERLAVHLFVFFTEYGGCALTHLTYNMIVYDAYKRISGIFDNVRLS